MVKRLKAETSLENFYMTLFDPGDYVHWGTTVYETEIELAKDWNRFRERNFFCINPLRGPRSDANIRTYRNILVEFDGAALSSQLALMKNVPHTSAVFSGNKSYHFIISLEDPCIDDIEYKQLVRRIYAKLPQADKAVKNPSRLSRSPGAMRESNEKETEQSLLYVKERVSTKALLTWLGPIELTNEVDGIIVAMPEGYLSSWCRSYLRSGSSKGSRNRDLFVAACEMARAGYTMLQIKSMAKSVNELPIEEFNRTILSAVTVALRDLKDAKK